MADGDRTRPVPVNPDHDAPAELLASRRELSAALTRQLEFLVNQMKMTPDEAAAWVRDRGGIPPEEREADQVAWSELMRLLEGEPERGEALWRQIKEDARQELTAGIRAGLTIEPRATGSPWDRARFVAILAELRTALAPRDGLEDLLVQEMACALESHFLWQRTATDRAQEERWEGDRDRRREWERLSPAQRERHALDYGWMPPRVSTAEAIDQAVLIADRYQRSFLRLLKAYRDTRRLFSTVVLNGGQLNVAEQQIVSGPAAGEHPDNRDTRKRGGRHRVRCRARRRVRGGSPDR
jgi:hypothetical protein